MEKIPDGEERDAIRLNTRENHPMDASESYPDPEVSG
jgi:hypothetical protein